MATANRRSIHREYRRKAFILTDSRMGLTVVNYEAERKRAEIDPSPSEHQARAEGTTTE